MKTKEPTLNDFEIFEKLGAGFKRTYAEYPDTPIIGFTKSHMGISRKALEVIRATSKDQVVVLNKNGSLYLAVISILSKIKGYNLFISSSENYAYCNFKIEKRGFDLGYYKLNDPIYVGGLDLFELEYFDLIK